MNYNQLSSLNIWLKIKTSSMVFSDIDTIHVCHASVHNFHLSFGLSIGCNETQKASQHAALMRKSNNWLARNRIMCPSEAIFLSVDCCFSKLALYKSNSTCWSSTKWTSSSSSYWKLSCSHLDIAEKLLTWHKQHSHQG